MNENRQIFVNTYLTNGYNATQAYKTAYPNCKSGWNRLGHRLMTYDDIKQAIDKAKAELKSWLKGGRELVDKLFEDQYNASILAKDRTNAIRCVENKSKNVGYYAADNLQRTEQAKLTEVQVTEAKAYAKWRLIQGLTEPEGEPKAKDYCLKCHKQIGGCSCQAGWYKAHSPQDLTETTEPIQAIKDIAYKRA